MMVRRLIALSCLTLLLSLPVLAQGGGRGRPQGKEPEEGKPAPDFELRLLGSADDEDPVRLSDFKGKRPVVLLFGSYT